MDRWSYCDVCKRNHEEQRKHIFSSHHKAKLAAILSKFSKKVRSARKCLGHPSVVEGELEPGEGGKMWCYCCGKELCKHITSSEVSVEWGGLLQHMSEPGHHQMTRRFWWLHGADSDQLQLFLLHSAEYRHYKELTLEALSRLEQRREARLKQLAEELRLKEEDRRLTALEPPSDQQRPSTTNTDKTKKEMKRVSWSESVRERVYHPEKSSSSKPVPVVCGAGSALTSITPKQVTGVQGNIHTGATPPWLRDDPCDDSEGSKPPLIGPSVNDFILHREKKKRAGKNPNRVGADFHIKLATQKQPDTDDWLPAFGRVWNHGPRFHSKEEFLQELNEEETQKKKSVSDSWSAQPHSKRVKLNMYQSTGVSLGQDPLPTPEVPAESSTSEAVRPYRRRRVWDEDLQTYIIQNS